ncbi:PleD family two-component system response regulator [Asticcacaulis sp. ZE23SCel15]|uniref:PleD family two-component system response regulator n=1 Tax=Asticcacaulis sp. ZE23SCel15 TaxID=3059027 RepID=UPI00265E9002|nr:PleD family two-component system response regulator [Asticcacaulis sp. ZE23SCel15]WKL57299.1 PleD family two-component system response regulator [Asticcacaulis sp. ZE23SCel15]
MTAKVLVVDDTPANVKLLQAKLEADYYDVIVAETGDEAISKAVTEQPDIILLDVMMPGMDGYATCRWLKEHAATSHIPIILVTALDGHNDRLSGLEAGADDFLTKPVDIALLTARLRSLVRLKVMIDELRQREASSRRLGMIDEADRQRQMAAPGNVFIIDDNERQAERLMGLLGANHRCAYETDTARALEIAAKRVDLVIINLSARGFDPLRLIAQLRSHEATRHKPILGIASAEDRTGLLKALELGANDIIVRPVDGQELSARVKTLIHRKRYADHLRVSLDRTMELAVTDTLTGLNNRRFMDHQLLRLVAKAIKGGPKVSLLLVDIDHFKKVNDTYGHDGGDEVLKEFARRLGQNVRAIDLPCRMGGEEFVVIMPETEAKDAAMIAERVRAQVAAKPFSLTDGRTLDVTISVGVSTSKGAGDTPDTLMKRADQAVYEAKQSGRNRVIVKAAA